MATTKLTARWFEQPDGGFQHGIEIGRTYVTYRPDTNTYGWFAGMGENNSGSGLSQIEAIREAETALRKRLAEAVELMGGHVVWAHEQTRNSGCSS